MPATAERHMISHFARLHDECANGPAGDRNYVVEVRLKDGTSEFAPFYTASVAGQHAEDMRDYHGRDAMVFLWYVPDYPTADPVPLPI